MLKISRISRPGEYPCMNRNAGTLLKDGTQTTNLTETIKGEIQS